MDKDSLLLWMGVFTEDNSNQELHRVIFRLLTAYSVMWDRLKEEVYKAQVVFALPLEIYTKVISRIIKFMDLVSIPIKTEVFFKEIGKEVREKGKENFCIPMETSLMGIGILEVSRV